MGKIILICLAVGFFLQHNVPAGGGRCACEPGQVRKKAAVADYASGRCQRWLLEFRVWSLGLVNNYL